MQADDALSSAAGAAVSLRRAVEAERFYGWDPYDALASRFVRAVAVGRVGRQLAIQSLRRSPVNIRMFLGVPRLRHTKALALFATAYARLGDGERAAETAGEVAARAIHDGDEAGWGYDFDVQTRWGYYRRGTPNAVVTAFALRALLDAGGHEELVESGVRFALRRLFVQGREGPYFGYYPGSTTAIHNANLLVTDVLRRAIELGADGDHARVAAATAFTVEQQRPDGSWPYGEGAGLEWVDTFHTAYVLETLAPWVRAGGVAPTVLHRGLDLMLTRLIDPDGAPRNTTERRYPVDVHAASSAIAALARVSDLHADALPAARRVLRWSLANFRRDDGRYAYRRYRWWRNSIPYIRWGDAHMLVALAEFLCAEGNAPG